MDEAWSSDWTRATLPLAILQLLSNESAHGYQIIKRLDQLGFSGITGGTLYPALTRLADQGWITHEWTHEPRGPGRKVFALTDAGYERLVALRREAGRVVALISSLSANERKEQG